MKKLDLMTKLIILVLALGVWALVLSSFMQPSTAYAQQATQYKIQSTYVGELQGALDGMSRQGWRLHSMEVTQDSGNHIILIYEK